MILERVRLQNAAKLLLLWLAVIPVWSHAGSSRVEYRDGELSVELVSASLAQALEKTSQATGVTFSIDPSVTGMISDEFAQMSLEAGIRRLLSGYNYMMLFEEMDTGERRVDRVIVLGEIGERTVTRRVTPAVPTRQQMAGSVRASGTNPREVVLQRDPSGHYLSAGKINDVGVHFLVDTGATLVAISDKLARRIGLRYGTQRRVETANGRTQGYETVLNRVKLGGLHMDGVRAIILPKMKTEGRVLLGMSFLEAFELVQSDGKLVIRQHAGNGK